MEETVLSMEADTHSSVDGLDIDVRDKERTWSTNSSVSYLSASVVSYPSTPGVVDFGNSFSDDISK